MTHTMHGLLILLSIALYLPVPVVAETVYRSVDEKGRVVYGDKAPAAAKSVKTLTFKNLPSTPLPDSVLRYQAGLVKGAQDRKGAQESVSAAGGPVLFTTTWCPYCKQAKAYLAERKVSYREYDIEQPEGKRALAAMSSAKGVPVLVANGQELVGFSRAAYDRVLQKPK